MVHGTADLKVTTVEPMLVELPQNAFKWMPWAYQAESMQDSWGTKYRTTGEEMRACSTVTKLSAAPWKHNWAQGYQLTNPRETLKDVRIFAPAALRAAGAKRLFSFFSKTHTNCKKKRMPYFKGAPFF